MKTNTEFLASLRVYPEPYEIDDSGNSAQTKASEYVSLIDNTADVTVEDGEVYIKSVILNNEQKQNAQTIYDEEFCDQIIKLGYSI